MRYVILAGLLAGCATSAPPYTGATYAQARWAGPLAQCREYEAAPGLKDQRVIDRCRDDAERAQAEDAAEREQIQAAWQRQQDGQAAERRAAGLAAMSDGLRQYANTPLPPPIPVSPSVRCTSNQVGTTTYTNCN